MTLCRNDEEIRGHNYVLTATVLLAMTDDNEDQDKYSDGYIWWWQRKCLNMNSDTKLKLNGYNAFIKTVWNVFCTCLELRPYF